MTYKQTYTTEHNHETNVTKVTVNGPSPYLFNTLAWISTKRGKTTIRLGRDKASKPVIELTKHELLELAEAVLVHDGMVKGEEVMWCGTPRLNEILEAKHDRETQ